MTTVTQQLADALRSLQAQHCTHFNGSRWKDSDDDAQAAADRALAAYDAQTAGVPEPTLEMLNAGWRELERQGVDPESVEMRAVYDAMHAAAPTAQPKV